jgi:hypothetical protein
LLEVSTLRFEKVWKRVLRVVEEFQHSSVWGFLVKVLLYDI